MGTGYRKQIHAKMDMNKLKGIESCWSTGGRKQQQHHQLGKARIGNLNAVARGEWQESAGGEGGSGDTVAVLQLRKDGIDAFTGRS